MPPMQQDSLIVRSSALILSQQENTNQIAVLCEEASKSHIAEHIRGMVAATMGNLSIHVSDATLNDATQWQRWALDVADELELPAAA